MISQGTWNKKTHQIYNTDTKGTHKFKMANTPLTQKEKLLNLQQNEVCSLGEVGNASTLAWLYDIKRRGKFPERCKAWFQKMNPLEFKLRHPRWKASQLWFHGAAREKEQSLWQDNRSGLIPYASSLREMDGYGLGGGDKGTGGWEIDSNSSSALNFSTPLTCIPNRAWRLEKQKRQHTGETGHVKEHNKFWNLANTFP